MSRSTVSTIVGDLIRRGLVTETGTGLSNGGRRPVILSFNEDAYSIVGIDLQVDRIRLALTNLRGGIRHWWQEKGPVQDEPEACLDLLLRMIHKAQQQGWDDGKPVIGIGMGLPGPVHPNDSINAMNEDLFPRWRGFHLQQIMRDKTQLPLAFEKDANLGALAEHWWNNPKGPGNLAYITSQLQAGLVFNGRVHRGSHGLAGHIGQALLCRNGVADDEQLNRMVTALLELLDLDSLVLDPSLLDGSEERLQLLRQQVLESLQDQTHQMPRLDFGSMGERQVALGAATQILNLALDDFTLFPTQPAFHASPAWGQESSVSP